MENTNKHKQDDLRRIGSVLIPAIAYGDAAGLPVETRSAQYIADKYSGGIQELIPAKENPFYGSSDHPGMWSDDTQLTLAVAKALIKADGFSLPAMVETHLEAYDETAEIMREGKLVKRGWGGSTTAAMEKLHAGEDPTKSGTRSDKPGNGVLMKMAPLAYWHGARHVLPQATHKDYDQLTNMTHDSAEARVATRVHGDILTYLLREEYDKTRFMNILEASAVVNEFEQREWGGLQPGDLMKQMRYLYGPLNAETINSETDGKGFNVTQTLARVYGVFMENEGNFKDSVFEAVNLGGDTDSAASIVASISVFKERGKVRMPLDHLNIERLDEIKKVSRQLATTALAA